jgi:hypothetical protein
MQVYTARRVLRADRTGSSWPVPVETDAGVFYAKLRGAAQAPARLVAEIIVGALADALQRPVPARVLIEIRSGVRIDDPHEELRRLSMPVPTPPAMPHASIPTSRRGSCGSTDSSRTPIGR